MKNIRRFLLPMLLILAVFAVSCASAETNVSDLSVSKSVGNDRYLCLSFDFSANEKEYSVFLTGIHSDEDPSLWAAELAETIAEHFAAGESLRIATKSTGKAGEYVETRIDLMDVEKQNLQGYEWESGAVPEHNSDSVLCWAASASNALEISGWGRALTEKNPGVVEFLNEDDIFEYFDNNFTDSGFLAVDGEGWLLNGANVGQSYDATTGEIAFGRFSFSGAQLLTEGSGKLAPEYCPTSVVCRNYDAIYEGAGRYVTLKGLRDAADDLEKGYGLSVGISFGMGGHDLAITGTVREKTEEGKGDVLAIFLSDSDNDAPTYSYDDEAAALLAGPRRDRVNSFEMYAVKEVLGTDEATEADGEDIEDGEDDVEDGVDFDDDVEPIILEEEPTPMVVIVNYWMHPTQNDLISDLMSIRPYSADLPQESNGTRDVYSSPDIVPT